jgi:hypothetical protein
MPTPFIRDVNGGISGGRLYRAARNSPDSCCSRPSRRVAERSVLTQLGAQSNREHPRRCFQSIPFLIWSFARSRRTHDRGTLLDRTGCVGSTRRDLDVGPCASVGLGRSNRGRGLASGEKSAGAPKFRRERFGDRLDSQANDLVQGHLNAADGLHRPRGSVDLMA